MLGLFGAFGVAGGLVSGALATVVVPQNGQMVMLENKEHFSAWHRYLLLSTLPTFVAILGLFWLPESPRYLLEAGREVEALSIYQKIYRSNRTRGGYSLTELELPGARGHRQNPPTSVLAGMAHSINLVSFL
jgi:MFS transporter, VNT family, synaptic vesicle glycoprotein 2